MGSSTRSVTGTATRRSPWWPETRSASSAARPRRTLAFDRAGGLLLIRAVPRGIRASRYPARSRYPVVPRHTPRLRPWGSAPRRRRSQPRDPATRRAGVAHDTRGPHQTMAELQRTLLLVKPDGVQRLLVGRVLTRFEERGLKLVGLKLVHVDRALAEQHYAVHREKPFFRGLVEFITSGPLVAAALEGPNAIAIVRAMNGATRPHEAAPGSIRGDLAVETAQNLVHASDSPENAAAELALWFRPEELLALRARDRPLGPRPRGVARPGGQSPPGPGRDRGRLARPRPRCPGRPSEVSAARTASASDSGGEDLRPIAPERGPEPRGRRTDGVRGRARGVRFGRRDRRAADSAGSPRRPRAPPAAVGLGRGAPPSRRPPPRRLPPRRPFRATPAPAAVAPGATSISTIEGLLQQRDAARRVGGRSARARPGRPCS